MNKRKVRHDRQTTHCIATHRCQYWSDSGARRRGQRALRVRAARAQAATLMAVVFISKRLDASTEDYRRWYIDYHAPDFLEFGAHFLTRYTQDFVEKGHMAPVDCDCISEFGYKSHELRKELFHVVETPEAREILARHPRIGDKSGPNEAHDGPCRYSIDEQLVAGKPRAYDRPGTFKQVALLRIKGGLPRVDFYGAVQQHAADVSHRVVGKSERMMVDIAVLEPGKPEVLYDAVIQLWPKNKTGLSDAFKNPPAGVDLVNILDLLAYKTDLSNA